MVDTDAHVDEMPPSLKIVPTIYPTSPPVVWPRRRFLADFERFCETGPEFESVSIRIEPPERTLALLEQLGPSPFERGGFPVIGFLATTYDKVSRHALERR